MLILETQMNAITIARERAYALTCTYKNEHSSLDADRQTQFVDQLSGMRYTEIELGGLACTLHAPAYPRMQTRLTHTKRCALSRSSEWQRVSAAVAIDQLKNAHNKKWSAKSPAGLMTDVEAQAVLDHWSSRAPTDGRLTISQHPVKST